MKCLPPCMVAPWGGHRLYSSAPLGSTFGRSKDFPMSVLLAATTPRRECARRRVAAAGAIKSGLPPRSNPGRPCDQNPGCRRDQYSSCRRTGRAYTARGQQRPEGTSQRPGRARPGFAVWTPGPSLFSFCPAWTRVVRGRIHTPEARSLHRAVGAARAGFHVAGQTSQPPRLRAKPIQRVVIRARHASRGVSDRGTLASYAISVPPDGWPFPSVNRGRRLFTGDGSPTASKSAAVIPSVVHWRGRKRGCRDESRFPRAARGSASR